MAILQSCWFGRMAPLPCLLCWPYFLVDQHATLHQRLRARRSLIPRFRKSRRRFKMRVSIALLLAACGLPLLILGGLWAYASAYGLHVVFRHGGTFWVPVSKDSASLSSSMRLALADTLTAVPGDLTWRPVATGFEAADPRQPYGYTVPEQRIVPWSHGL